MAVMPDVARTAWPPSRLSGMRTFPAMTNGIRIAEPIRQRQNTTSKGWMSCPASLMNVQATANSSEDAMIQAGAAKPSEMRRRAIISGARRQLGRANGAG